MSRLVTVSVVTTAVVVCVWLVPASASPQNAGPRVPSGNSAQAAAGEFQGVVTDDHEHPLRGVVVSVLGPVTVFAVTDDTGRFSFTRLTPGSYLVRAHLQGYEYARPAVVQVSASAKSRSSLMLTRSTPEILSAGFAADPAAPAPAAAPPDAPATEDDHGEVAWRLRHLKRSALRDGHISIVPDDDDSFWEDSMASLRHAMGASARLASSFLTDLPLSGQLNLLTSTSFDRPQDLFDLAGAPKGVAYVSLAAPTDSGSWHMRGALSQGDLSSWVLAGSYVRRDELAHDYEAGLSYSMQSYLGGNAAALAAMPEGRRNAGSLYGYDTWQVAPALTLNYGARYSRYDYLDAEALFSPRVAVTMKVHPSLHFRVAASRREVAPGAEEFQPPSELGIWLPPERTFSPLNAEGGFRPERVDHYEIAAEQDLGGDVILGFRVFGQQVSNQAIALFGVTLPKTAVADIGHYYVASAGDLRARGWGVSVSRTLSGPVRASIDYTHARSVWQGASGDARLLSIVAPSTVRRGQDRLHDLTTSVNADVAATATRVMVMYSVMSSAVTTDPAPWRAGTRFDVEVRQELPFLRFTSAQWAMLLAIRNRFRDEWGDASVYDEVLVMRPPKRVVGGLTVRF